LSTQGKPKKGRGQSIIAREAKRSRPSTEPDYEDEDDPDMNMYGHGSLI
jgi:chromatin modification-related protein EAF6